MTSTTSATSAIIALGSNLPFQSKSPVELLYLAIAEIERLDGVHITNVAPFLANKPVGISPQNPSDIAEIPEFTNTVIEINTNLQPHNLLHKLQEIENKYGRKRSTNVTLKLSRTLDLDIIEYGDLIIEDDELTIPHPLANERDFVQIPLGNLHGFNEAVQAIMSRAPENQIDPTLDRVKGVLESLGNPQNRLKIVHITGTNGKTSTATMIRNFLRNAGLKTGLFTSPHIFSLTERIQILDGGSWAKSNSTVVIPQFIQENADLARRAAEIILDREISDDEVEVVLAEPTARGRFEEQTINGMRFIFDVAHNPHGAKALTHELATRGFDYVVAIVAQFEDKNSAQFLQILGPAIDELIITENSSPRSRTAVNLAKIAQNIDLAPEPHIESNLQTALDFAMTQADAYVQTHPNKSPVILTTGSVTTVADALKILGETPDIPGDEVAFLSAYTAVMPAVRKYEQQYPEQGHLSFFEILTCMAYFRFNAEDVDVAVVEVGMGGHWDATNVMSQSAVSVITPIDIDHIEYLGNTLTSIATEKAGILKHNTPAVIAPQFPEVQKILETCKNRLTK